MESLYNHTVGIPEENGGNDKEIIFKNTISGNFLKLKKDMSI